MSPTKATSTMKKAAAAATKSSWADVVKKRGQSSSDEECVSEKACNVDVPAKTPQALQPGKRGSRTCLCRGLISVMLGPFGWIEPLDDIDDPLMSKSDGQIYLHKRDIVGNKVLKAGQAVTFYLYADDWGLGAEACCAGDGKQKHSDKTVVSPPPGFDKRSHTQPAPTPAPVGLVMKANAPEFVPTSLSRWPSSGPVKEALAASMNVNAAVFVPSTCTNLHLGAEMASCEDSCKVDMRAIIEEYFCDDSDDETESTCSDVEATGSPSSAEVSSDSDPENPKVFTPYGWVRPPPGLSLLGLPAV